MASATLEGDIVRLDETTYSYWPSSDPLFQEKFTTREEFRRLALPYELEPKPRHGEYYKQQTLIGLFLQVWDYIYVDHDPGVGKSGAGIYASELFHVGFTLDPATAYQRGLCNYIEGTVIFTPSSTVDGSWISSFARHTENGNVPSYVQFFHFEAFYGEYYQRIEDAVRILDHKFIILDEVQKALGRSEKQEEYRERYNFFVNVFQLLSVAKIMLATGSPLTISTVELAYAINIFPRGPALKMPTNDAWHTRLNSVPDKERDKMLFPYINGLVSRLKSVQRYSRQVWPKEAKSIGVEGSDFYRVVELKMSKEHSKNYQVGAQRFHEFNQGALQFSLFGRELSRGEEDKLTTNDIHTFGPIIEYAANVVKNNPNKKIFIVSHWITHGIAPMKRALDLLGYSNINIEAKGTQGIKGIFPETQRKRYGVLEASGEVKRTGENVSGRVDRNSAIVNYYNRERNDNADYLHVILSSEVGTTSISLNDTEIVMILDPGAQLQIDLQRKERVFRVLAHQHLYSKRLASGMSEEEAVVPVVVYFFSINDPYSAGTLKSATLQKYRDNAIRDLALDATRRSVQRIAFDAQLFEARNIYAEKVSGKEHVGFYGNNMMHRETDKSTHELFHDRAREKDVIDALILLLVGNAYSISVESFVENYVTRNGQNRGRQIYRQLSRLVDNPQLVTTFLGEQVYIHLDTTLQRLYVSPERFHTPGNSSLALYTTVHRVLVNESITLSLPVANEFATWGEFEEYIDKPVENVQNKAITERIKAIEGILRVGEKHPFYLQVLAKYPRSIRLIRKPVDLILRLSQVAKNQRKVVLARPINETTIDAEVILVHAFWNQRDPHNNGGFNVQPHHLSAKYLALKDSTTQNFVLLEKDEPEYIVYSREVSLGIREHYQQWQDAYEESISRPVDAAGRNGKSFVPTQNQREAMRYLYGVYWRPENIFRLQDERNRPIVYTSQNKVNQSFVAKTQKHFSYNIEDFLDMIAYLDIAKEFILATHENKAQVVDNFEKGLKKLIGLNYKEIFALFINEIPREEMESLESELAQELGTVLAMPSYRVVDEQDTDDTEFTTAAKPTRRTQKKKSAIVNVLKRRLAHHKTHLTEFATFYLLYKNKDKPDTPGKNDHVVFIEKYLRDNKRVYEFV